MMTLCEVHPSEIPAKAGRPKLASRSAFRTNSGRYSPSGSFPTMLIANERSIFTSAFAAERYWVGGSGSWSDDPSTTNSLRSFGYPSTTQAATGHGGAGNRALTASEVHPVKYLQSRSARAEFHRVKLLYTSGK